MNSIVKNKKLLIALEIIALLLAIGIATCIVINATTATTSGNICGETGAYLRKEPSTKSAKKMQLEYGEEIRIKSEVFAKKQSNEKTDIWYSVVTMNNKKGYVRSDMVNNVKYSKVKGQTTRMVNCYFGAGKKMPIAGSLKKSVLVTRVLSASQNGSSVDWYKIKRDNKYYYVKAKYVSDDTTGAKKEDKLEMPDYSNLSVAERINEIAKTFAWPLKTKSNIYKYPDGNPTDFYRDMHAKWPRRTKTTSSTYGAAPMLGASCDRFVGCVIWTATGDENYPNGYGFKNSEKHQGKYMEKHPEKWEQIPFDGDISVLKAGDIILYAVSKDITKGHCCLVVEINGQLYIAEASLGKKYPYIKHKNGYQPNFDQLIDFCKNRKYRTEIFRAVEPSTI